MNRSLRAIAAALVAVVLTTTGLSTASAQEPTGEVPVVRLDGRGHGHGVGLSQWGAYSMARNGATAGQILAQFYPGTQLGQQGGEVVVVVDTRDRVRIGFPSGGELRSARGGAQAQGFPVTVGAGGVVEIVRDGSGYRVQGGNVSGLDQGSRQQFASDDDCIVLCEPEAEPEPDEPSDPGGCVVCSPTTTAPPEGGDDGDEGGDGDDGGEQQPAPLAPAPAPTQPPPPGSEPPPSEPQPQPQGAVSPTPIWAVPAGGSLVQSVDRGRTYRGLFEVTGPAGALRVRNHVDVEAYLAGMAEVPSTWPAAAVQAQSIAARTYALRAMASRGELCDSERCQVYVGTAKETPGQSAAVQATRGQVVTFDGSLAATFYSASGGGVSANIQEGFGSGYDIPYLQARPYATENAKEWSLDIALDDVGRRLGYPGTVTGVRVTETGPSGRPLSMELEGDAGPSAINPQEFRRQLGLQSTFFTASTTRAEAPPPPPPPATDQLEDADFGEDQLDAVLPTRQQRFGDARPLDELAAPLPDSGDGPGGPTGPTGLVAMVAMVGLAGAFTVRRLSVLGPHLVTDGLGGVPQGSPRLLPSIGLPPRMAATMARWTNRSP